LPRKKFIKIGGVMKKVLCLVSFFSLIFLASCSEESLNPVLPDIKTSVQKNDAELLSLAKELKQKGHNAEETAVKLFPDYSDKKVNLLRILYSAGYQIDHIVFLIKRLFRYNYDDAYNLLVEALGTSIQEQYAEAILKIYKDLLSTNQEKLKYYTGKLNSVKNQLSILVDYYNFPLSNAVTILKELKITVGELAAVLKEMYYYDALETASLLLEIDFSLKEVVDVLLNIYNKNRIQVIKILLSLDIDKCEIYRILRIPCVK
jgi:hypothetical protein